MVLGPFWVLQTLQLLLQLVRFQGCPCLRSASRLEPWLFPLLSKLDRGLEGLGPRLWIWNVQGGFIGQDKPGLR